MTDATACRVDVGDRVPFCYGVAADRSFWSLDTQAGRSTVAILLARASPHQALAAVAPLLGRADAFAQRDADLLLLGDEDVMRPLAGALPPGCPMKLVDVGAAFAARCGASPGDVTFLVIDRNGRLALRLDQAPDDECADACLACLDRLPREAPHEIILPAPVLMLPNVLPAPLCARLIAWFEANPSMEGEVASMGPDGQPVSRIDRAKKSRRDMPVAPCEPLYPILHDAILGHCAPEMARAFQARVTHLDRLLIARYDDTGGWFRRHRDNLAPSVAFREFAISVNLNEDYDGGHLIFPEYNDHAYRPRTGAGAIFSTSLLHEATPVTRGRRYVLLTFMHGDAAEVRRQAWLARSGHTA